MNVRKPCEECTPAQIAMIEAFLSGDTKTDAFCKAFPDRAQAKGLITVVMREFKKDCVVKEIEKRRAARDAALKKTAENEYEKLSKMWSREQHLAGLIELKEWSSNMRQTAKSEKDRTAAGKLERDTYESIGKFMGYDAPIKLETDSSITVKFNSGNNASGADVDEDWLG